MRRAPWGSSALGQQAVWKESPAAELVPGAVDQGAGLIALPVGGLEKRESKHGY